VRARPAALHLSVIARLPFELAAHVSVAAGPTSPVRTIGVFKFVCIVYFLVCGGPFGIEIAVTAAGALPTLIGFFVMPFVWSFPQVCRCCASPIPSVQCWQSQWRRASLRAGVSVSRRPARGVADVGSGEVPQSCLDA
jgi:hypothetical protein